MRELHITEINACSDKASARKLRFRGPSELRIAALLENLSDKEIISIHDVSHHDLCAAQKKLKGYHMVIDPSYENTQKWRYTCLSVMFVKNGINIRRICFDGFPTTLRCVGISFALGGHEMIYRSSHIPCVDAARPIGEQVYRKQAMLSAELEFQNEHCDSLALCAGDYNCDTYGEYYCGEIFRKLPFSDLVREMTYGGRKLDHAFVSDALRESNDITVAVTVRDLGYMVYTDHKSIDITLKTG